MLMPKIGTPRLAELEFPEMAVMEEESFEDIVYGIIGLLVFVVLPLYWKPSRKAIGLMNIIIGTLISLTVIGAALGIPMIIFGGILFFI